MVEKNIVDAVVIPETPKVQEGAVEMVYVPVATNDTKGIASYDAESFNVVDGKVYINSEYIKNNIDDELANELGEIQVCCVCQTMITESTGSTITTSKSPNVIKEGEPVVGQFALYSNGVALVESVGTDDFTAKVIAYHYIKINGDATTRQEIYAPTKAGTAGQVLVSTTNEPIWRKLTINGSTMTSDRTIYAPTTGATAGKVLTGAGKNTAPVWENFSTLAQGYATEDYVDERFSGSNNALTYDDYSSMFEAIRSMPSGALTVGQNIMIVKLDVPDLWVSSIESTQNTSSYDESDILNSLKNNGSVKIGYYRLSALETQKVDLTDYYNKTEVDELLGNVSTGGSSADVGEIQFCCISTNSSGISRGSTGACNINTIIAGEPVVGGRVLFQNGSGLITSIRDDGWVMYTVERVTNITLNGSPKTPTNTYFFAPTAAGTEGQVLVSQGSGKEPVWSDAPTGGGSADIGEIQFCCVASLCTDTPRGGMASFNTRDIFLGTPVVGGRMLFQNGFGLITSISSTSVSFTVEQVQRFTQNGVFRQGSLNFYAPTASGTSGQILQSNGAGKAPTWVDSDTIGGGGSGGSGSTKGYTWSDTWDNSAILVKVTTVDSTFVVPISSDGYVDAYVSSTTIDKKMWYDEKYDDKGNYKGSEYDSGLNEVYLYTYNIYGWKNSLSATRNSFIISKNTYEDAEHFEPGGYDMKLYEFGAYLNIYDAKYLVKEK